MLEVEFLWWGGVGKVIFMSNPTTVLGLCCVVAGVVTMKNINMFLLMNEMLHIFRSIITKALLVNEK